MKSALLLAVFCAAYVTVCAGEWFNMSSITSHYIICVLEIKMSISNLSIQGYVLILMFKSSYSSMS